MWASGERSMPYPTLELQIKSFLSCPAWRCSVEKGNMKLEEKVRQTQSPSIPALGQK